MTSQILKGTFGALTIAAAFCSVSTAHAANLVDDGNFANAFTTYQEFSTGQTFGGGSGTSWTVGGDSVDVVGGYWSAPTAGGGSVDLDGSNPGSISQTFNAPVGSYQLSFSLSGNPDPTPATTFPTTKVVKVNVDGVSQTFDYTVGPANSHTNMLYIPETLDFTVTTPGPVTLSFLSLDPATGNSNYGAVIGDVSIDSAVVPLPSTFLMFATALCALAGFTWVKRRGSEI